MFSSLATEWVVAAQPYTPEAINFGLWARPASCCWGSWVMHGISLRRRVGGVSPCLLLVLVCCILVRNAPTRVGSPFSKRLPICPHMRKVLHLSKLKLVAPKINSAHTTACINVVHTYVLRYGSWEMFCFFRVHIMFSNPPVQPTGMTDRQDKQAPCYNRFVRQNLESFMLD
jgi:hypothetical protein